MNDETMRILFDEPQILAVALLVALAVAAAITTLGYFTFRSRKTWVLTAVGTVLFAILAVVWGDLAFTRWALYDGGHGRALGAAPLGDWLVFAGVNAILAAGAGIAGGLLGMVFGLLTQRRTPPRSEPPQSAAAEGSLKV